MAVPGSTEAQTPLSVPAPLLETVVMHFGSASVGDSAAILRVADRLVTAHRAGSRVVAVVSALGQTTDELVDLAHRVSPAPDARELDMLLSVGERIACALVAMAVRDLGHEAISLTGSQAGIITDAVHGRARIVEIRARRVQAALDAGRIVLVAALQGMSEDRNITTLGYGGSDLTAVALAKALEAKACEIYTDVDGVFTADPRIVADARLLDAVGYDEMLELAAAGASALQLRSVEFARNHGVRLHVRSAGADGRGTWVAQKGGRMERAIISSIAHTYDEAVYRVQGTSAAELTGALADRHVNVDTIIQTSNDVIVFSAPLTDRAGTAVVLDQLGTAWSEHDDLGKISIIGSGMKTHPGVAAQTFETLRDLGVEPRFIATSPIKIAFYVPHDDVERAIAALHATFELEGSLPRG